MSSPKLDEDEQLTVKPVDGSLSWGGVVKGDRGLPFQLPRLSVRVQVDHGQAGLLVDLRGRTGGDGDNAVSEAGHVMETRDLETH